MKYYIRTTHNFNNETREWEYRNLPEWNNIKFQTAIIHSVDRDCWENQYFILKADYEWSVNDLGEKNIPPDYKEKQIKNLDLLVELDMIRCKKYMRKPYIIPKNKAKDILSDALKLDKNARCDELDCSISFYRQDTDKTPLEVLNIGLNNKNTLYSFIYRAAIFGEEEYFDVGLSTIGLKPEYFLWISLSIEDGEKLITKYNLQPMR